MKNLLLIIDVQKSFINKNTKDLPEKIQNLVDLNKYDHVVFTRFINSEENITYKELNYQGCMTEEEKQIVIKTGSYKVIDKNIYTALNEELSNYIRENDINELYLCGIDTECCVLKTAFDLFEKGYEVYVLENYCACTLGKERHNNAIEILKRNIGKNRIK